MKRSHNLSRSRFGYIAASLALIGPGSYFVVGCGGNQTVNLILQIITVLITRSAGGIVTLQNATLNVPAGAVISNTAR